MKQTNCIAFIFARGGSKGVLRKNIKLLGNIPLIAHSINVAQKCPSIAQVIVSTDNEEIAKISKKYGAKVPFIRPAELAQDKSNEYQAWKHAILEYQKIYHKKIDIFVSLPPTSPMRCVSDVEKCIQEYKTTEVDTVVTVKEASRNPYFNMLKNDDKGFASLVNFGVSGKRYIRRQDAPKVFDMTTVAYVSSPDFILNSNSIFDGKIKSILIPDERALDIDTLLDFKFAEFLMYDKEKYDTSR